jgi:UPF0716 protein FxsA
MAFVVLVFVIAPICELYVFVQVAHALGFFTALAALIGVSIVGGAIVRREGWGIVKRVQSSVGRGELPATDVIDGFLVLAAGVLIMVPGFVTDALGFLLLVPPIRALVRFAVTGRFRRQTLIVRSRPGGPIDVPSHETDGPGEPGVLGR